MNFINQLNNKQIFRLWMFLLILLTVILYGPVRHFDFVNYDDPIYVDWNPIVQKGITWEGVKWAFTEGTTKTNYWAPLTWLSFMADFSVYGRYPGGFHITNVTLHLFAAFLLGYFFYKSTGEIHRAGFLALLFALHPLHVESVAWVTERKDVVCGVFWMLTLVMYYRYTQKPTVISYFMVCFAFLLGLMGKPMIITLPFALLLLDVWPLKRIVVSDGFIPMFKSGAWKKPLVEKLPFFLIIILSSIATYITQQEGGAIVKLKDVGIIDRFSIALTSYVLYIWKMIFPVNLAAVYPHPGSLPIWQPILATAGLLVITGLVLKNLRRTPVFAVGWFWYLGTMVPVIGFVAIGPHAMADRYAYITFVGLYMMVLWGIPSVLFLKNKRPLFFLFGAIWMISLCFLTYRQVFVWQNSITLFEKTLAHTKNNYVAHTNLARAFIEAGRLDEAREHLEKTLSIQPDYLDAYYNLGTVYLKMDQPDKAIPYLEKGVELYSKSARVWNNLGGAYLKAANVDKAIFAFKKALALEPDHKSAGANLNTATNLKIQFDAIEKKIKDQPDNCYAHYKLGLIKQQAFPLASVALVHLQNAVDCDPLSIKYGEALGVYYASKKEYSKASHVLEKVYEINPKQARVAYNLACIKSLADQKNDALLWLKRAIENGFHNVEKLETDSDLSSIRNHPTVQNWIQTLKKK